jgi:Flp pilus assembly protein protease CpaA
MAAREISGTSTYSDKLFALIPAEVTAAFIAIHAIVDPTSTKYDLLLLIAALILLAFNIPYLFRVQGVGDYKQIAFTCGAFVFWAAGIENARLYQHGVDPTYVAVFLILYTLGAPFIIKPRTDGG